MASGAADLSTVDGGPIRGSNDGPNSRRPSVPTLTILGHPSPRRVGERVALPGLDAGAPVLVSRLDPQFIAPRGGRAAGLLDVHLSRAPVRIIRLGDGRIRFDKRDTTSRILLDGTELESERDFPANCLDDGVVLELADRAVLLLHRGPVAADSSEHMGLLGDSLEILRVRQEIRRVTDADATVLIVGETGSGKELVAHAVHHAGLRRERPFVAVNMGAIPGSLAGAELFGSERGSFTGSIRNQAGHFRTAADGTLFLDEIGETPFDVQAMLLRALDTGQILPIRSSEAKPVGARVIAATDADLHARVEEGTFRAPLLHRLANYTLVVPPLRARRDDIARLFFYFLGLELERRGNSFDLEGRPPNEQPFVSARVVSTLARFDWPGNVRQLRNVVRQLVIGNDGAAELDPEVDLAPLLGGPTLGGSRRPARATSHETTPPSLSRQWRKPGEVSESELLEALRSARWDLKATAERLRISRTSLYALLESTPSIRRANDLEKDELVVCHRECEGDVERMVDRLTVSKHALLRRLRQFGIIAS